jgi:cyclase
MIIEKHNLAPGVIAFVHPEGRSNCGMIMTSEGVVLIDTSARLVDIQACMRLASITPAEVCLVLITHSHSDHTSGIRLFSCPVLAHKLVYERIKKRATERAKMRMPTEYFEDRRELEVGGKVLEMIHLGGHTPGSSVVWLPHERILFVGDLIFQGRYPFLATANVPKLMKALKWLPSLGAKVIVPGHGVLCDNDEVEKQRNYIERTWERTAEHIQKGHDLKEMLADVNYPRYSELGYEKLHPWNIKVIYQQLMKNAQ